MWRVHISSSGSTAPAVSAALVPGKGQHGPVGAAGEDHGETGPLGPVDHDAGRVDTPLCEGLDHEAAE